MIFLSFFLTHVVRARAQEATLFSPSSNSWQLIGDVGRVPRSALAQLGCPPPLGHENEIVLLMLNNRAAGIAQPTLTFTGAAVSVQGAVMTGLDESVLTTMDDAGRSEPLNFPAGSIDVDTGAACDVEVAFYNNLTPNGKHTLAVTPNGGTIRMALFNATVFSQPIVQSSSSTSSSTSSQTRTTQSSTLTSASSASFSSASAPPVEATHTTSTAAIVVPVVLVVLACLALAVFFLYRRRRRRTRGAKWAADSSDGVVLRPYLEHERGTSAESTSLLATAPPPPPEKHFATAYRMDAKPGLNSASSGGPSSATSAIVSSTSGETEPEAEQLRAIHQAVQRAGFSTHALLESLNRVQNDHVPEAPREEGTGLPPPRYDG